MMASAGKRLRSTILSLVGLLLLLGWQGTGAAQSLVQARAGFVTKVKKQAGFPQPAPTPPSGVLELIHYPSAGRSLVGYLTPRPKTSGRLPAIIWISGGDCNTIGDFWSQQPAANDQSASAFREAGIVTFYPSLRGGNNNPGMREGFYGEVDDVRAAYDYLLSLDYVDPARIYLGGHSTGGTLALLTAEMDGRFRSVFAFGPVADVAGYGPGYLPISYKKEMEIKLRSPVYWLDGIKSRTFVLEGTEQGNADQVKLLATRTSNPAMSFFTVPRASHFSVLAPTTKLIARKIVEDRGTGITITASELANLIPAPSPAIPK
jgi:acetyl esterase/lipase